MSWDEERQSGSEEFGSGGARIGLEDQRARVDCRDLRVETDSGCQAKRRLADSEPITV